MRDALIVFAANDSMLVRLGVCAVASLVGVIFIAAGIHNINTQTAEEGGKRRLTNELLGQSDSYEGSSAVAIGWLRIVCGVAAIIFGITFIFVGPFLAR